MIWVIAGAQYGSEGKGAFCAYAARGYGFKAAVRGGGPQAGHTFYDRRFGGRCVVRQVPVACVVDSRCIGYIGPGAVVDLDVLREEIEKYELQGRLFVHPQATVLMAGHKEAEERMAGKGLIPGSTKEGVGAARATRALREATLLWNYWPKAWGTDWVDSELKVYSDILRWSVGPERVMAEGAQGFGLSNFHGAYPYVTSADTTPPAVLSECGLPILGTERVIVVTRTMPIRVGGPSGPFQSAELSWGEIGQQPEFTTVTGRQRRVAEFEWGEFERMLAIVRPNYAALTFCDYLDPAIRKEPMANCPKVLEFWREVHKRVVCPWIGVGGLQYEFRGAMTGVTMFDYDGSKEKQNGQMGAEQA